MMTNVCLHAQLVRQANTTLALPADLPVATGYTTDNVFGSLTFTEPVCTSFPAGETNRVYVIEKGGLMHVMDNLSTTPVKNTFFDLSTYLTSIGTPLDTNVECGLIALVFHPNYQNNGYFYLYFSLTISGQRHQRLARFQSTLPASGGYLAATSVNGATMTPLLTIYDEANNHNGGDLHFGQDGYLYLSLGDEGSLGDSHNNARFINKDFWGQMLRLDVDNDPANLVPNAHTQPSSSHPSAVHAGAYRVPADNPFIGRTTWHGQTFAASTVRTEIFATGLRNPYRFCIDAISGRIFLGDVGQGYPNPYSYEEINLITAGGDYGWSWREGLHPYYVNATNPPRFPNNGTGTTNAAPSAPAFTPIDPIFEYDRTNDGSGNDAIVYGTSVCGGMVYRGNAFTDLQGAYLFTEIYGNQAIVALRETSPGVWSASRIGTATQIVDWGVHPGTGEPLLCSLMGGLTTGTIRVLRRISTTGSPPPAALSDTGAFSNLSTLTPNAGIVPYDPNVNFWSDHASKSRWFAIKNTSDTITYSSSGNWAFPAGMVWIKHFDIETTRGVPATRRRLETRFLVKTASDVYGLSYRWNAEQTDAVLVAEAGFTETVPGSSPAQTWRYPSRSECRTCHTAVGGFALSFNTPQMNRAHTYGAVSQNQIQALSDAGYFSAPVSGVNNLPAFAAANDTSQSLEWRVRSYLAVNCVQCHQPGGAAQVFWNARFTSKTDAANLINGLLAIDGDGANRFVVPGDAAHSMLLKRQQGNGVPRMPPLGTFERDLVNEQLVSDWIASLTTRKNFAQWQAAQSPAVGAAEGDPDGDGRTNLMEYFTGTNPNAASSRWNYGAMQQSGGALQFQFTHPANRAAIIEVSSDLQTWRTWDVPGNVSAYPAVDTVRTVSSPLGGADRFFRVRFEEL